MWNDFKTTLNPGDSSNSVYDLPPIVQPAVTPVQFLELLQANVSSGLLKSSKLDRYHSKPEYVYAIDIYPTDAGHQRYYQGFYVNTDWMGYTNSNLTWLVLEVGNIDLLVNLNEEKFYIRRNDCAVPWEAFDKPVHLDWYKLLEQIEYI